MTGIAGWRDRAEAMIEGLRRIGNVCVETAVIGAPASDAALAGLARVGRGAWFDDLAAFYREADGIEVAWSVRDRLPGADGVEPVRGRINLLSVSRLLEDWTGVTGRDGLRPFDLFAPEACVALPLDRGERSVRLLYFGEGDVDTGHDLSAYLDRLLVSRGWWYWIQTLSADTDRNPEARAFRRSAPLLFPDYDDALFRPR